MPAKILVADDDTAMLKLYRRIFAELDYSVTLAASVAEASGLISSDNYDLLITDFDFNDGKGTELIELFSKKKPDAKSFLVTGSSSGDDKPKFEGLTAYFEKPFNVRQFVSAVQEALA
jgi:DNA-binding NtrC family response regulator